MGTRWVGCALLAAGAGGAPASKPHFEAYTDVFVAGAEGAGHHGVVAGFLAPLLRADPANCVVVEEMPERFVWGEFGPRRDCAGATRLATVGWESLPSQRRVDALERLGLVDRRRRCLRHSNVRTVSRSTRTRRASARTPRPRGRRPGSASGAARTRGA